MDKYKINIIELDPLYSTLYEIKNKLSFDLSNFNTFDSFFKEFNNSNASYFNSLIISDLSNYDRLLKLKKLNFNDIIFLLHKGEKVENYKLNNFIQSPLAIKDLIEKINIYLLKKIYQKQSNIKLLNYEIDINSRKIFNNKNNLKLTEREVEIIIFLKNSKNAQTIINLQKIVWGYSFSLETHTVETHIHRLRKKIKEVFGDEDFILSKDNGYFIE
jgi:DNA-binding response OmpR family regulator